MEFTSAKPQLVTYEKVRRLTRKLQEPGNVNEKRKLALELEQLMSSYDVQAKLAKEATPSHRTEDDFSFAASRCRGLSTLWAAVFTAAIQFTNAIIKGENGKRGVKPTPADIGFPDKLLRAATGPDPVFDAHGLAIPKLNKKTVRGILRFCLEMLDNEKVIESGGERQMLEMLARICSRPEYLGFVKEARFQTILSEITSRLTEKVSDDAYVVACKAFDAFFETCSQLGHPFHAFLADSLRIVSEFFERSLEQGSVESTPAARVHMFNAAASMLFAHPDHSIGPMKRYGRPIFRCCKKTYANAPASQREAMNKYLLAHVFVAQVAGKVQGRLDGDLGDLGPTTLSEHQILDLLSLVVPSTMKVLESTIEQKESRARKRNLTGGSSWQEMDTRQKLHLELTSRLLACGQRLFLAREGWDMLSDETFQSLWKTPGLGQDTDCLNTVAPEHPKLPPTILVKSPWMALVLRGVVASSGIGAIVDAAVTSKSILHSSIPALANHLTDSAKDTPLLDTPIPFLAIIAACCDAFPAGECWTSNPAENWRHLDAGRSNPTMDFHASSPDDLALVLLVMLKCLEIHGRPEGDTVVQYWIMLCLTKLAATTAVMLQMNENDRSSLQIVTEVWRSIWKVLFRPELRYTTYSKSTGENSLGEMLHLLLSEIVRRKCTETTRATGTATGDRHKMFIFKHQRDIWGLHTFKDKSTESRKSRSHFELAAILLKTCGLSEENAPSTSTAPSPTKPALRRGLLSWSLTHLDGAMRDDSNSIGESTASNQLVSAIASCVIGFSTGYAFLPPLLTPQEPRFLLSTSVCGNDITENGVEDSVARDASMISRLCPANSLVFRQWCR